MLRRLLADDVSFRALLPLRIVEVESADEAATIMSGWFDGDQTITQIEVVDTESMSVEERVTYRFRIRNDNTNRSYRVEHNMHTSRSTKKEKSRRSTSSVQAGYLTVSSSDEPVPPHIPRT